MSERCVSYNLLFGFNTPKQEQQHLESGGGALFPSRHCSVLLHVRLASLSDRTEGGREDVKIEATFSGSCDRLG